MVILLLQTNNEDDASKSGDDEKQQVEPTDPAQTNSDGAKTPDSKATAAPSTVAKQNIEPTEDKVDNQPEDTVKLNDLSSSKSDGNGPDAESPIRLTLEEEESFHDEEVYKRIFN